MTLGPLRQLCDLPGMPSQPTMMRFIRTHPDFPVIQIGRRGQDYVLDLEAAAAFVAARWVDRRRKAPPDAMHLPLFRDDGGSIDD